MTLLGISAPTDWASKRAASLGCPLLWASAASKYISKGCILNNKSRVPNSYPASLPLLRSLGLSAFEENFTTFGQGCQVSLGVFL